jgi:hypothetical protein
MKAMFLGAAAALVIQIETKKCKESSKRRATIAAPRDKNFQ